MSENIDLRAPLAHSLRPRHVAMIALGGIIGAGIFVGSSAALKIAGPGVILTYCLCGAIVFVIMRMLGEMAMARPGRGSFTEYVSLGLGHWAGFTAAWLYYYFWVVTIAVEAIAGANMLAPVIPLPVWAWSAILIAVTAIINLLSVRTYGEFEFWFASLKVLTILAFIAVGAAYLLGFLGDPGSLIGKLRTDGGVFPYGAAAVFTAIPVVIFSMMGSEVATIAAVETEDPAQNVVRAARTVTLRILVFYIGSIAVIVSILPLGDIVPGESPFVAALSRLHIPYADALIGVVIFTAITSCLNSAIYVTSRVLHELAQNRDAPSSFARVSARRVPFVAILVSAIAGFLMVVSSVVSPDGLFIFLLQSSGATILSVYLLIGLSEIRLRRRLERAEEILPVKVWLFPYLSYALAAGIVAVLLMMVADPGQRTQVTLSGLVFATCVAVYWMTGRSAGRAAGIPPVNA